MDHSRLRNRHLDRPHRLIAALAIGTATLLIAVLSACGGSAGPTVAQACATAVAALPPTRAAATKTGAQAAARTADMTFATLNHTLGAVDAQGAGAYDLINLRNATAALAIEYRNLGALLAQPGSGLIGPLKSLGLAAYGQIGRAGADLGIPACAANALGQPLFVALAARTVAPAGPNLTTAGTAACQNIVDAYGTTQVAIDPGAADAQLQRSAAALDAAATDLAAVPTRAGRELRAAITQASGILTAATRAVDRGAAPAPTTTAAFRHATDVLGGAFRSAGIRCAVPGA